MPSFDSQFWNLSQAAAWVVYRKRKLVEEFSEQTADGWGTLLVYPDKHEYEPVASLDDLVKTLTLGKLTAWGRRNGFNDELEAIPAIEWIDLRISPPSVKRSHHIAGQIEPWICLRFESSRLKTLWHGSLSADSRTRYRWDLIKEMWQSIDKRLPNISLNEKILELQGECEDRFGSRPGRSTIQSRIKMW